MGKGGEKHVLRLTVKVCFFGLIRFDNSPYIDCYTRMYRCMYYFIIFFVFFCFSSSFVFQMDKQREKLAVGRRGQPDVVRQRDRGEVKKRTN